MSFARVVLLTAQDQKQAEQISKMLLEEHLAACVNIIPQILSRYWWQGKIETAKESLLIVKTKKSVLKQLIKKVRAIHSYTVPEIIALPIEEGNPDYLNWITESLKPRKG
ncbi:MAG: cytochrome C biogenesis protein CcdA [Elusimicrobia bacterium RIFCSPLOWO2_02_FULL_39_32]|nr:MAG: cytochrome C biogenesis protein CcdA [Elusimicrobia bacterium GWA2_38_7]OGR79053.1 MAG: cytochrome C biogenesis protein CcdA [Elusimicrobia bacterium RIFCSPHIGHO2_02_FULL_39_36]OGR92636.1 MAG: cytochrome C biogenesis protein CcdA [Elusimicrobia bacterium RIFCSPLOWO2_02_FULL_39_32]OGR99282.1 MAG: cytochrome C biogenesis protein CcdA [Elusimicrobia bacterium RIFCSPLOWO2_12_FULL_39_28]